MKKSWKRFYKNIRNSFTITFLSTQVTYLGAQNLSGQFSSQSTLYVEDSVANGVLPKERIGSNTYLQLRYDLNKFSAGIRAENYSPVLQGYDSRFDGFGITNKFISYNNEKISFTVGDIYEQFGEGLGLRTYWDWNLGFDNSIQGVSMKATPFNSLTIKALAGKQRNYFSQGEGIVRGADAEFDFMSLRKDSTPSKISNFIIGANFVSKYQEDKNPLIKLPENVSLGTGRLNFATSFMSFKSEVAFKINDPSFVNNNIYKEGNAQYLNLAFFGTGLGVNINYKRVDNMDFRSDRTAFSNDLFINYLPAITQNQTYQLYNLYPYFTQTLGEQGVDLNVDYKIKKESKLGGKNGANLHFNFSSVYGLKTIQTNNFKGYKTDVLKLGDSYYQFIQLDLTKKLNPKWSSIWTLSHYEANNSVLRLSSTSGIIPGTIAVVELNYKKSTKHNWRSEVQSLFSNKDRGSWASLMIEYTFKRKFGVSVMDNFNYKTYDNSKALHYPSVNLFYKKSALIASAGYGRQNAGALCVGGICRFVPAYSGANLSVTYSF